MQDFRSKGESGGLRHACEMSNRNAYLGKLTREQVSDR